MSLTAGSAGSIPETAEADAMVEHRKVGQEIALYQIRADFIASPYRKASISTI